MNQTTSTTTRARLQASSMTTITEFESAVPRMAQKDQDFASSLLGSWKKHGHLTDKQMYWATTLVARIDAPTATPVQVSGIGRIRRMFDAAASKLKYPKIWLGTEAHPLRLSIAGPTSRHAGSIMVTDGRPFGSNRYYGAIDLSGNLKPGRDLTAEVSAELSELGADPEGKAGKYGRLTGNCCFCNTPLTDDRSVAVGYGPVCAKNFGLTWGARQQQDERLAA